MADCESSAEDRDEPPGPIPLVGFPEDQYTPIGQAQGLAAFIEGLRRRRARRRERNQQE